MKKERIFIGLGSNIGDKEENIQRALELITREGIKLVQASQLIETKAYGYENQANFVNAVAEIDFKGSPQELLKILLEIEIEMKRKRVIHWGPRIIDLDILLWGQRVIKEENLIIPHLDMENRNFVLEPLAEIAPEMIHPLLKIPVSQILANLNKEDKC